MFRLFTGITQRYTAEQPAIDQPDQKLTTPKTLVGLFLLEGDGALSAAMEKAVTLLGVSPEIRVDVLRYMEVRYIGCPRLYVVAQQEAYRLA